MITRINNKKNTKSTDSYRVSIIKDPRTKIVAGLTLILFSLYLFITLISFFFTGGIDQSLIDIDTGKLITDTEINAHNPGKKFGAFLSDLLINRSFGISSFIFCYLLLLCGLRIAGRHIQHFKKKIFFGIISVIWGSLFLGFIFYYIPTGYVFPGGIHGYFMSNWITSFIGGIGTFFLLLISFAIILFFGSKNAFNACNEWFRNYMAHRADKKAAKETAKARTKNSPKGDIQLEEQDTPQPEEKNEQEWYNQDEKVNEEDEDIDNPFSTNTINKEENKGYSLSEDFSESFRSDWEKPTDVLHNPEMEITVTNNTPEEQVADNLQPDTEYDPTLDLSHYEYPSLDLLEEHSSGSSKVSQEELEANKNTIVETLRYYKIEITKIKATIGPTVTLYEIVPAPGIKISKIKSLEDDIALSLAALGIRIIAPIPGAGTVGIEVPNRNPEIVSMRGIIASKKFQESKYALPVALGRTISNEPYTFDLAKMPHLLVAGATGQGKSVGLNAIITSLLYKKHPSQLKFVMVDPKKVELSIYSVIEKHFLAKLPDAEKAIITDNDKVVATLNSLCIEMDNRYRLLEQAHVRNIKEYNDKFVKRQLNPNNGHRYLPYIVVVVDEFADLIMTAGKEVETPIARIAQLARAVGIHMIIATQRPSTNIITGVIKANFPARIAFKVASMIDSRTILDSPGANQLIGRGDMLISKDSEMVRVQCAFVDTPEVEAITQFIAHQQGYPEAYLLPEYQAESDNGFNPEANLGEKDPLFDEAARLVVSTQQGSTSSIQRRFSIGYNRAGRIMDQLEAAGIVGPFTGSKARDVLVPDEYTLEQMLR